MLTYGTRCEITRGFYKGQTGIIIGYRWLSGYLVAMRLEFHNDLRFEYMRSWNFKCK